MGLPMIRPPAPRLPMRVNRRSLLMRSLAGLLLAAPLRAQVPPDEEEQVLQGMMALLNTRVVSASRAREKLSEAPATVIVVTAEDLEARGYRDLTDLIMDLPGMQPARAFGDTFFKNYWRGFRNTIGDPFVLMVDGLPFNHLYFNLAEHVLLSIPMSAIDRVEVVYGPASSVYGSNAFMGVINVLTRHRQAGEGTQLRGALMTGSNARRIADLSASFRQGEITFTLAAKLDNGSPDGDTMEAYEYTKNRYITDRRLWGSFVDNPRLAGTTQSEWRNRAVDLRARLGSTEVGFQSFLSWSGYGTAFASDRKTVYGPWVRPETSFHLRHSSTFTPTLSGETTLRYRDSGVRNDSVDVERFKNAQGDWVVQVTRWQSLNTSWIAQQDFQWAISRLTSANFGLVYEQKDLQKAYDNSRGPEMAPSQIVADASGRLSYPFPSPTPDVPLEENRTSTEHRSFYVQARAHLGHGLVATAGARLDHNSQYGKANTIRAGLVGNHGGWGWKALYGQAFQEPSARTLFGGWKGSGSDPNLKPERSSTMELSGTRTSERLRVLLTIWDVRNKDVIVTGAAGAANLGTSHLTGADLHLQANMPPGPFRTWEIWGYGSRLFRKRGENPVAPLVGLTRGGDVGDLADLQLFLGTTIQLPTRTNITLQARHTGSREVVATNPVGQVPAATVLDMTVTQPHLGIPGLSLFLKINNLTNRLYYHPGLREANAGTTPGHFVPYPTPNPLYPEGQWVGSGGFYSSLLAQPGREITLGVRFQK